MPKKTTAKTAKDAPHAPASASPVEDSPVYVYVGAETGERDDAIASIAASMKKRFGSVEEKTYYATETSVGEVLTAAQGVSLFDGAVCVVYRAAELIKKKDEIEAITSWAYKAGDGTSALVLVSDENAIDAKIEKAVPPSHKKIFYQMFENRKVPYLMDFFRRAGYSITSDAASDILDMIENDTAVLKNECSRFFVLFPKGHNVTSDDVENVLCHDRDENAFTLFDALSGGTGGDALQSAPSAALERPLEILERIRLSKDNSSVMLIAGLSSCFRRLILWHHLSAEGAGEVQLRQSGFAARRAREQYGRAARVWTAGQCAAILSDLCNTDMDIRSGGAGIEDTLLTALIYRIVVKRGASLASYE